MNNSSNNNDTEFNPNLEITGMDDVMANRNPQKTNSNMSKSDISKINEEASKPVQQEAEQIDDISKNNKDIDQFYQQMIDKDWGSIEKLTNRDMYEQVQAVRKQLLNRSADYRMKFYSKILDTRLTALTERCSEGLVMIKGHYRSQVTTFMASKLEELKKQMAQRQKNFIELMKDKYDYVESLDGYPELQESYRQEITGEEKKHMRFLDQLINHFESIIEEELSSYE